MNALVMCGGRGRRLRPAVGDTEKPLVEIGGRSLVDRVVDALGESHVDEIVAAVSPQTPDTAARLLDREVRIIETPGDGYVADLTAALDRLGTPAVTVTADLPLVTGADVDRAITAAGRASLTVCVPLALAKQIGVSAETTIEHEGRTVVPTGLNVVGDHDNRCVVWRVDRLAVNVNRPRDLRCAEQMVSDS